MSRTLRWAVHTTDGRAPWTKKFNCLGSDFGNIAKVRDTEGTLSEEGLALRRESPRGTVINPPAMGSFYVLVWVSCFLLYVLWCTIPSPRRRKHILGEREKKAWTLQLTKKLTVEELFNANDITSKAQESWAERSLGGPLSPPARGAPFGTNRA